MSKSNFLYSSFKKNSLLKFIVWSNSFLTKPYLLKSKKLNSIQARIKPKIYFITCLGFLWFYQSKSSNSHLFNFWNFICRLEFIKLDSFWLNHGLCAAKGLWHQAGNQRVVGLNLDPGNLNIKIILIDIYWRKAH